MFLLLVFLCLYPQFFFAPSILVLALVGMRLLTFRGEKNLPDPATRSNSALGHLAIFLGGGRGWRGTDGSKISCMDDVDELRDGKARLERRCARRERKKKKLGKKWPSSNCRGKDHVRNIDIGRRTIFSYMESMIIPSLFNRRPASFLFFPFLDVVHAPKRDQNLQSSHPSVS